MNVTNIFQQPLMLYNILSSFYFQLLPKRKEDVVEALEDEAASQAVTEWSRWSKATRVYQARVTMASLHLWKDQHQRKL
jgi:hypothetical protein